MEIETESEIKLICFIKWKQFFLEQRLKKLQMIVVTKYSSNKSQKKFFAAWKLQREKSREILRLCKEITNHRHTLKSFIENSSLEVKITKQIYIIHHDRIKTLRKYFNLFLFHHKIASRK